VIERVVIWGGGFHREDILDVRYPIEEQEIVPRLIQTTYPDLGQSLPVAICDMLMRV